jgi:integrase
MAVFRRNNSPNWVIQFQLNGDTFIKSSKTTNKKIAERMEVEWKAELHASKFLKKKDEIAVKQMLLNYLNLPLARTSLKNGRVVLNLLQKHTSLDVNASAFDQRELHKWVEKRRAAGTKESTLRTQMLVFSSAWNRVNRKVYEVPDLDLPKLKQPKQKTSYLSPEQEDLLLTHLLTRTPHAAGTGEWKYEMHDVIAILLDTGARYNEIAMLQWNQVDLKNRTIELWRKKTSAESFIFMTDRVHQILQRRASTEIHPLWVFTNWKRTGHRSLNTSYLNALIKSLGIPHTVHTLRHTFATKLLKAGMTLLEVKELLAHSSIATTQRYAHLEVSHASPKAVAIINQQTVEKNRAKLKAVQ